MRRPTGRQKLRSWARALLRLPFIETIPLRDLTVTRMHITEMRIRDYWRIHGRLPRSLDELPALKNRDDETTDGWGQPIEYAPGSTSDGVSLERRWRPRDDSIYLSGRPGSVRRCITKSWPSAPIGSRH